MEQRTKIDWEKSVLYCHSAVKAIDAYIIYLGIFDVVDVHLHSQRGGAAALRFRKINEPANHVGRQSLPFVWAGGITRIAAAGWANAAAGATGYGEQKVFVDEFGIE